MRARRERGFTIVETLAALTVFSIITIGVVPLLGSSMRSLGSSRDRGVAENVARAAVERMQGIRYYVSWDAKGKKVDLLDYYLPQVAGSFPSGQSYGTAAANPPLASPASGGTGVFTTVCPPPSGTNLACPPDIPAGYTVTFKASFVEPLTTTTPQTYRVVNPSTSYSATPLTAGTCTSSPCTDKPPADLIDVQVTASWTYGGRARTFSLRSLIGDRTFSSGPVSDVSPGPSAAPSAPPAAGGLRVQGSSTVDYLFRGETGYSLTSGSFPAACGTEPCNHSELTYTIGMSDARIEARDTVSADVSTRFAEGRVVRTYPSGTTPPSTPPADLTYVTGATSVLHAPPYDYRALDNQKTTVTDVPNPDQPMALQGRIYQNENYSMKVDASGELPQAEGYFRETPGAAATGTVNFYMNNTQRDPTNTGPMHFDPNWPIMYGIRYTPDGVQPNYMRGHTTANTGALGTPDRRVETSASVDLPWMYLLPRLYAGNNGRDTFNPLTLYEFSADVNCKSTANPTTAAATGSWSAKLMYYYDANNNGSVTNGRTAGSATITSSGPDILNGVSVPDALAALKAQNPLIYDTSSTSACCAATSDMYLFDVRTGASSTWRRGYLTDWAANKNVETSESSDGRVTSASINGAIRIETAGLRQTLTPELPQTAFSVSFGKLACTATDNR